MAGFLRAAVAVRSISRRISSSMRRSYGASAAAVDYDSEWEEEEEAVLERLRRASTVPEAEAWGDTEVRGVQWVFMGTTGAQKRVYATRLAEILEVPYISMGTLVRQDLHPRSSLYMKIANSVHGGKMVPEDIIIGLLSKRLEEGSLRGETGFILDGIPRTRAQAEILDQIADVDLVINLKCTGDSFVKHLGGDICSHCGKSFDPSNSESSSLNPCLASRTRHFRLKCASETDIEEIHMKKFQIYSEQSKLLEEYYRKQNKLIDFKVSGGQGETWRGLLAALHLPHMDATGATQKLTA